MEVSLPSLEAFKQSPEEHRVGPLGTGRGSEDGGFQALSQSKNCQTSPLPGAWGQPAPATPAGRPRTDIPCAVGTRVHGARAAPRFLDHSRFISTTKCSPLRCWRRDVILTGTGEVGGGRAEGKKKLFCQHCALSARQNGLKSSLKGPLGRALPADNWNSAWRVQLPLC